MATTYETRNGNLVVVTDKQNTAGIWESRLYRINEYGGKVATRIARQHKTKAGAIHWANSIIM